MAIKQETIDVRYCDFCDSKQTDDESWVMICKNCGRDACNKCCHRMIVSYSSPTLSSYSEKQFKFGQLLCKECVAQKTREIKDFLYSRGFNSI